MRTALRIRVVAGVVFAVSLIALAVLPAHGQLFGAEEITSSGPLTRIIVSNTLTCQVAHRDDEEFELFGGEFGSCGTYLSLGDTVFGPEGGNATLTAWTAVTQAPVTGRGLDSDPFRLITTTAAAESGVRLEQADSYVVGSQSYRTDITITNGGGAQIAGILYRAGDCYLQNDDTGFGRVDNGAPACIVDPALGRRIEQWTPITPGSHYMEGHYGDVFSVVGSQQHFPDRCACGEQLDNGAGLSWSLNLAPGASVVISHETFFSPVGRGPVEESFENSVPDPTQISLDPIVVAQSIAVTAGVIVLVPFPSALFNSTLEDNYDEVMAGLARIRAWLARVAGNFRAWVRRRLNERRTRRATGAQGPRDGAPPAAPPAPVPEPVAAPPAEIAPPAENATPQQDLWRTPLGILGFLLLSALLYSFLDPTFGFSLNSLANFVGMALGLFVVVLAYGVPIAYFARKHGLALTVRALPATLAIGILCVLISRLVNFQPGYLYGLIIGFFFVNIAREQEGPAEASAAGASLAVAFVAWVGLYFIRADPAAQPDLINAMFQTAFATIVVAGLENAVFAMLPLRFLPGAAVFDWNRRVWLVIIGLGLFGFAHVLLNPSSGAGYMADSTRTSFFTLVALLVAFGLASVLFWAYFRFRPKRASGSVGL